jgi:hypothetical protein
VVAALGGSQADIPELVQRITEAVKLMWGNATQVSGSRWARPGGG